MGVEFVAKNGLIAQNNSTVSGSLTVTQGVTASLQGTASWATNFVSATDYVLNSATSSFATTGSNTFTGLQVARSDTSGFAHRTTDYVAASTGTSLFTSLGAATGDTYGVINVRTAGGLSGGVLALNTAGGAVTIGKTVTLANATLDISGNTVMTGSLTVTAGITGTLTGTATTASSVSTLNQNVLITGSLTVGSASIGPNENTITLGARDTGGEGGQIGFSAPGGTYTSASFLDNYQNRFRILKGNNTTSQGDVASFSLVTNQLTLPSYTGPTSFTGTSTSILGTTSGGDVITMGGWTDYLTSSTIVGATGVTGVLNYMIMGKIMFLQVYLTGTSTATNWTFTIPASASATLQASVGSAINNNTTPGLCVAFVNSSTNVISLSFAATGNPSGTISQGWTASNTKLAKFNMTLNIV